MFMHTNVGKDRLDNTQTSGIDPFSLFGIYICLHLIDQVQLLCIHLDGKIPARCSCLAQTQQSATQLHRLLARCAWLPDLYQNWTSTSEQTMIYQDAPTLCWHAFVGEDVFHSTATLCCRIYALPYHHILNSNWSPMRLSSNVNGTEKH